MLKKILIYILTLLIPKKEITYSPSYIINIPNIPLQIYWIDSDNILLSSFGYTEIFNTHTRESNTIKTCRECIYGYDRGFFYCKYEHRDIQNPEQFSTTIYQYDSRDNLIFSKELFPTVVPVLCKRKYITLKTAYYFLEQRGYLLNVEEDRYEEIPIKKREKGDTTLSKRDDLGKMIVADRYARVWLYLKE